METSAIVFGKEYEKQRVQALESFDILNSPPDKEFDDLTRLAAKICEAPAALVTLIHADLQIIKAGVGFELCSTPREFAVCNYTIQNPEPITIIEDTLGDELTRENPMVLESGIRFYAGCPIIDENGFAVGSFCVLDYKKRTLNSTQKETIICFARQVSQLLNLRKKSNALNDAQIKLRVKANRFESLIEATNAGTWEWNIETSEVIINARWAEMIGYSHDSIYPMTFEKCKTLVHPLDIDECTKQIEACLNKNSEYLKCVFRMRHANGSWVYIRSQGKVIKWDKDQPQLFYGSNTDITNEMIKEAQLNTLSDNLPALLYRYQLDRDGKDRFLYTSKGVKELWGISRDEVIDDLNLVWNLILDEDARKLKESILESAKNLTEWKCEWRIKNKKGEIRWNRGKGKPSGCSDGSVIWDSIITDITEEKKLERKLHSLNKKLKTAQEISNMGNWDLNLKSKKLTWSDQVYRIFGTSKVDYNPAINSMSHFIHPADRDIFLKKIEDSINTCKGFHFEHRILWTDGTERWVRQIGKVQEYPGRSIQILDATIQDITHQKLLSLQLKETLEKYKSLEKATSDTMWDWTVNTRDLYWSDNFTKNFGHKTSASQGENMKIWEDNLHPEDRNSVIDSFKKILETGENYWEQEYRFRKNDGSYAYILDKGLVIKDEQNIPVRIIGAMQDHTKIKKNELLLLELNKNLNLKARELEISNAELEQFAYVASHDLQEPLRMISSFLKLLEKNYGEILDEKAHKYIHFATDGADRMKNIILDLLDYSRVKRIDEETELLDLNELLNEVKLLNKKIIDEKQAIFQIADLPKIKAYRTPVFRIFYNLINNALKYQPEGQIPEILVRSKETPTYFEFSVQDNGIGISEEFYDKIFIIFQRLHLREEFSGTGMGLAITKKFVESLNGCINVDSEPGKGSTFTFTIAKNIV